MNAMPRFWTVCIGLLFANSSFLFAQSDTTWCLNALEFNIVEDDANADNTGALQEALDSAAVQGTTVCLPAGIYYFDSTLSLPSGVTLLGSGISQNPISTFPNTGTVLVYTGTGTALEIKGMGCALENLVLVDRSKHAPANEPTGAPLGIHILAEDTVVHYVRIENVLISNFGDGTALKLEAKNSGGISYCQFQNIAIRHGHTGISLEEDATSFVNSNRFTDLTVSGGSNAGSMVYGIRIQGGNNNQFNTLRIEPPSSSQGHLVVESGSIQVSNIRVEGHNQKLAGHGLVPLIKFEDGTRGSHITGIFDGYGLVDLGDNFIDLKGANLDFQPSAENVLINSAWKGVRESTQQIPFWTFSDPSKVRISSQPAEVLNDHEVLRIKLAPGALVTLQPDTIYNPQSYALGSYEMANFGAFMKVNTADTSVKVLAAHRAENPVVAASSSRRHPGDNTWHFMGLTANIDQATKVFPYISMENPTLDSLEIFLTTPTYNFGAYHAPELKAKSLSTAGGILTGTLTQAQAQIDTTYFENTTGNVGEDFLELPLDANNFYLNTNRKISRINYTTDLRFTYGTTIQLLFEDSSTIVHSNYIKLSDTTNFIAAPGSSLELIAQTDGTWKEMNRNTPYLLSRKGGAMEGTLSLGMCIVDSSHFQSDTGSNAKFVVVPHTANTFFVDVNGKHIARVNDELKDQFAKGTILTFIFESPCTVEHGTYIQLFDSLHFEVPSKGSLSLVSNGDGTWREYARALPGTLSSAGGTLSGPLSMGWSAVDSTYFLADTGSTKEFLVLPKTGNTYELDFTRDVSRINDLEANQFSKGTLLNLLFKQDVTLKFNSYLQLNDSVNYLAKANSSMTLLSNGDGTWKEYARSLPDVLSKSGGTLTGPLAYGWQQIDSTSFEAHTGSNKEFLSLPLTGNVFELDLNRDISRINYDPVEQFDRGTFLHLLFKQNVTLKHGTYLNLKGEENYAAKANSSMILISNGDGTWNEYAAFNEGEELFGKTLTKTIATGHVDIDSSHYEVLSGVGEDFLILPQTGNTYTLNTDRKITRINYQTVDHFPLGAVVTLVLDQGLKVVHGAYIALSDQQDFNASAKSTLSLMSLGNGTWKEIGRSVPSPLSAQGGAMSGTLSLATAVVDSSHFEALTGVGNDFLVLPNSGNTFRVQSTRNISRINYQTADRYPSGTRMTLLFDQAATVVNSGYISLSDGANFDAPVQGSMELMSNGDGTWIEITRSVPGLISASGANFTGPISNGNETLDSTAFEALTGVGNDFLVLPKSGNNFNLDTDWKISRINYQTADRMHEGTVVHLKLLKDIKFIHSAYLTMSNGKDYQAKANESISLKSNGNGTWVEVSRAVNGPLSEAGAVMEGTLSTAKRDIDSTFFEAVSGTGSDFLILPHTGNTFMIQTTRNVTRINYQTADRFAEGTTVTFFFEQTATIKHNAYIQLSDEKDFATVEKASLTLIANSDGTWTEVSRSIPGAITAQGGSFVGPVTYGLSTVDGDDYPVSLQLVLPKTGNTFIVQGTNTIQRINQAAPDRFPVGTIIVLIFDDAGLSVLDTGYVNLTGGYTSTAGSSLTLVSLSGGTWREVSRNF